MSDNLPSEGEGSDHPLPTMSEWLANWLGFQLPTIPMPQAARNLDKAVGKILLAAGENAEARIKANTNKAKTLGKIAIDGLYRTAEEKRKLTNRADTVQIAVEDLNRVNSEGVTGDAPSEIDDDWLNSFSRIAEDKSSDELKALFGKILAGEVRKPGSYSLRTLQFLSTLSKDEANEVSQFFSFVLFGRVVPIDDRLTNGPIFEKRVLMEELGLASQPSPLGGIAWHCKFAPHSRILLFGSGVSALVVNGTDREIFFELSCQLLTKPARELLQIANAPTTDMEYMKSVARMVLRLISEAGFEDEVKNSGAVKVHAGLTHPNGKGTHDFKSIYVATLDETP